MAKAIKKTNKSKLHGKELAFLILEIIWYVLCGLVGLWGLTYIVIGIVAQNLPITAEDGQFLETLAEFKETFKLSMFAWGLIIFAIAAVAAVVVLLARAGKSDREFEKNARRQARLSALLSDEEDEVVDVPVEDTTAKEETPVEETPVTEEVTPKEE